MLRSWRHAVLVPGFPEVFAYVRAGVGVGILPTGAMPSPVPPDVRARLLAAPALSVPVTLIRLAGRHMSPTASSFWSLVLDGLKSQHGNGGARVVDMTRTRRRKA